MESLSDKNIEFITSAAEIGLWDWEYDTSKVIFSPEWEPISGYTLAELPQELDTWKNMVLPEDMPLVETALNRHFSGEAKDYQVEYRLRRKDGSIIWAQSKGVVTLWHKDGRPKQLVGIIQDVTKLKQTEEQLSQALKEIEDYNRDLSEKIELGVAELAEERLTSESLYNSNPHINIVVNDKLEVLDCNPIALEFFGFADKQDFIDNFLPFIATCIPEYMPDGSKTPSIQDRFIQVMEQGVIEFETLLKIREEEIPFAILMRKIRYKDGFAIAVYQTDLRRLRRAEQNLERQDRLLSSVNKVASLLISADQAGFPSALSDSMSILGQSAGVDRVYLWKNFTEDNELYCTQVFEWSEYAEPQQGNKYTTRIKYSESFPTWYETFMSKQCINGVVKDMCQAERDQLEPQGIVSTLVLPIFIHNELWGFIGFDDCHNERTFSETEENILTSGGLLIAAALLKNEMTERVRDSAAKMEAVIKNYTGIIWSIDKDNIITMFNGLYLKSLSITPGFLEGKNLDVARQKNRHLDIISYAQKTFTEGPQEWVSEVDGKMYRSHTAPICNELGEVTAIVGSTDDMTDTLRLQKELELAVEAAQDASQAKSNFLSNMSHEIRTPMNAIIGMTAIGKASSDIARKDYAFEKIEDASNHLLGIINDILDMSKIEAHKFELSSVGFNFEKLLQKVVNVINFRVDEKKQNFSIALDKSLPQHLVGDDQRLAQVITNLLSNAIKFTPDEGSIRLNAHLVNEEEGLCVLQVDISDTGIGITPEQKERLFSSFEQAESSTSRKYGGTGLGLAISRFIVESMGGSIWFDSEPGVGSTFSFTVALEKGSASAPELLLPGICRKDIRVLVVDDERETLEYFQRIAEQLGFACVVAQGGHEALEILGNDSSFDLYFIDWKMPTMNGIELTREIHSLKRSNSVIIMISAYEWLEVEDEAKEAGVDKFLPKPLFSSTVADCINEITGVPDQVSDKTGETSCFSGYRILLVEDIEINREIVMALLESTGIEIDCAVNGLEAVQMFSEHPDAYDIIFMDIQMPEMDGFEATRRIRSSAFARASTVPIVAMTANVFKEDIEKCLASGMNDHLGKPLDFDELMDVLHTYLNA